MTKVVEDFMSNVIKFERPPEPKAPKTRKALSPALHRILAWGGIVLAFVAVWGFFTLTGS